MGVVLSLFPGLGLLDHAFALEGFTTVRGPDVIWGGDVRTFHPPPGVFDGIIGGDPCQSHSALANLVRAKGLEPSFPDLTPEFQRVIEEAQPRWFLRENVPKAPDVNPLGYEVTSFLLCNSWLDSGDAFGNEQMRKRRFWFGWRSEYGPAPNLMRWIKQAVFELPMPSLAVNAGHDHLDFRPREKAETATGGPRGFGASRLIPDSGRPTQKRQAIASDPQAVAVAVAVGGSGKRKASVKARTLKSDGDPTPSEWDRMKHAAATARHHGEIGVTGGHRGHAPRYSIEDMLSLQGLPPDFLDHCPFTVQGKRKAIGNGVAVPTGRAIAGAIRCALQEK